MRIDVEPYNHLLATINYMTDHMGQLNIFWWPVGTHNYLVGHLGQLKIFWLARGCHYLVCDFI